MVDVWNSLILEILNKYAPLKSHRIKQKYQPEWITGEILDCMFKIYGFILHRAEITKISSAYFIIKFNFYYK